MTGIGFRAAVSCYVRTASWASSGLRLQAVGAVGVGMLLIGFCRRRWVVPPSLITQFQVSVTWLIASSLIVTGVVQLALHRYISDRLFESATLSC